MRDHERLLADLRYIAHPPPNRPDVELLAVLQRLDEIVRDPDAGLPLRLRHYLEQRSYVKALATMDALEENGDRADDDEDEDSPAPL